MKRPILRQAVGARPSFAVAYDPLPSCPCSCPKPATAGACQLLFSFCTLPAQKGKIIRNSPYAGAVNLGGLEGCMPSNHPSFSRAAEAQPPPHGKKGFWGGI